MEFLELLQSAQAFIPLEFAGVSAQIDRWYPYLYFVVSAIICFFGLRVHHIWLACFFFVTGFLVGAFTGIFFPKSWSIYIFIAFGVVLGALLAYHTHRLLQLQIFVLNAFMVFAALPAVLELFLSKQAALMIAGVAAVAVGLVAVRFKYILTILTTACMGATQMMSVLLHLLNQPNKLLEIGVGLLLAGAGIAFQFHRHRREVAKEKEHEQILETT